MNSDDHGHIKILLSKLMGEKRITQKDMAKELGISTSTMNSLYNEKTSKIDLHVFARICNYYNVEISKVLRHIPPVKTSEILRHITPSDNIHKYHKRTINRGI